MLKTSKDSLEIGSNFARSRSFSNKVAFQQYYTNRSRDTLNHSCFQQSVSKDSMVICAPFQFVATVMGSYMSMCNQGSSVADMGYTRHTSRFVHNQEFCVALNSLCPSLRA
jgi:hypothetical protein